MYQFICMRFQLLPALFIAVFLFGCAAKGALSVLPTVLNVFIAYIALNAVEF